MPSFHFSNFHLEDDTKYFLYIGELKNHGLNHFLNDALQRIYDEKFKFIAIVPDVFEQYNYDNLIVINPLIDVYTKKYGPNVSCRAPVREFITTVSETREVRDLIQE
ncbi:MAG: hypothetical protein GY729_18845, partial [Desulfobacteraceae bacterium]|nr:hypothetical protein [Desulfobacteraceae bacterium]